MYPTIHDNFANDLFTQGYGALSNCLFAEVTEELNGGFTLEMKYPLKGIHAEYLIPNNIIMAKPNHNQNAQPFRIHQVRKSLKNLITVYANHISYDLNGYPIQNAHTYQGLSAVIDALNDMSWDTGATPYHKFTFHTDKSSNANFSIDGIQSVRSWMGGQEGSIIDTYGGEWEYDSFDCHLKQRRGEDTGIRISYGKNLAEYDKERNSSQYSHICAWWNKDDQIVYSDLIPTEVNSLFKVGYVDANNNFENAPTVAQLNEFARNKISNNIETQTIKVTAAQMGNDVIGLGDSVLSCYDGVIQVRVIKTVWDVLGEKYRSLELGTKKSNITETIKSLSNDALSSSSEKNFADYVEEQGISGKWTYRKWHSGKYECWLRENVKVSMTRTWGSLYYDIISAYTYPITFIGDYPVLQISCQSKTGGYWISPDYDTYGYDNTGSIYAYSPVSASNVTGTINIYAQGKWK